MTPAPARAVLAYCDHIATTLHITAGQTVRMLIINQKGRPPMKGAGL
jgi:hypothetical protein